MEKRTEEIFFYIRAHVNRIIVYDMAHISHIIIDIFQSIKFWNL